MSIKWFCDNCGAIIPEGGNLVTDRLKGHVNFNGPKFDFELMLGVNGTMNKGELCPACVAKIMAEALRQRVKKEEAK